jgi:hypothetical protein
MELGCKVIIPCEAESHALILLAQGTAQPYSGTDRLAHRDSDCKAESK